MYKFDKIIKGDYMTYLDYSATTPVNEEVLRTFVETSRKSRIVAMSFCEPRS